MRFVLACYGLRGDVEPGVAVGRELLARGHQVQMAVAPGMVEFVESAGINAVAYGLDTQAIQEVANDFWSDFLHNFWRIGDLIKLRREVAAFHSRCWAQMCAPLMALAEGADLLLTNLGFEQVAANVSEYYDIPLATMHWLPARVNGQLVPVVPATLVRSGMAVHDWLYWWLTRRLEDGQRRELGLSKATSPLSQRLIERGALELQAYDEVCFPGLAKEWASLRDARPFVGSLTMELATDVDDEVLSWITAGSPPIFFSFGSMPVESAADVLSMIKGACAELGERALVCAASSDFTEVPRAEYVKIVDAVNYAAVLPACRAIVHHGGAGTTAAGLRAGIPALILWIDGVHSVWGRQLKGLKVGLLRRFSRTTQESLVGDLRALLTPEYAARASEIATLMTKPADSVAIAADQLERFARLGRIA